jgi:hypothetical protein
MRPHSLKTLAIACAEAQTWAGKARARSTPANPAMTSWLFRTFGEAGLRWNIRLC